MSSVPTHTNSWGHFNDEGWLLLWGTILLTSFYAGTKLKIIAVVLLLFCVLIKSLPLPSLTIKRKLISIASLLCLLYPIIVCAIQIARYTSGDQGVDFAIYAQLLHRLTEHQALETSLFELRYREFLTHHFSPYLYLMAPFVKALGTAPITLILLHVAALGLTILGFFRLTGLSPSRSLAHRISLVILLLLLPAFRIGMIWEVHDEIYALPLIVWSIYAIERKKLGLLVALLLSLLLFKETIFLVVSALALCSILRYPEGFGTQTAISRRIMVILLCGGACAFILYTRILPGRLFSSTFDGLQRICSLHELTSPTLLRAKLFWLATLMIPVAPLLAPMFVNSPSGQQMRRTLFIYSIPSAPLVGSILLSNFPAMFHPYNYYSVVPTTLILCATVLATSYSPRETQKVLLSLFCAAFLGARVNIPREIREGLSDQSSKNIILETIPADSVVISGDYGASYFYKHRQLIRLFHANKSNAQFDFIAIQKGHHEKLSLYLRSWSEPWFENQQWQVRRALNSRRVK